MKDKVSALKQLELTEADGNRCRCKATGALSPSEPRLYHDISPVAIGIICGHFWCLSRLFVVALASFVVIRVATVYSGAAFGALLL
jgi:hypothetical protein